MAQSGGGETAAKRSGDDAGAGAGAGEDHLSALPDDVLVLILLRLDDTAAFAASRTSVLSRRWRRVWRLLPELSFSFAQDPSLIASVLDAHGAALRCLLVETRGAAPEPVADLLTAAARRLSGRLVFQNRMRGTDADDDGKEEEAGEAGAFELPCLEKATAVSLDLGFLGLAVPAAGVFARLTELSLTCVHFHGPCELGDAVSSPRCPSLQRLRVCSASGVANLAIRSESLLELELQHLPELEQLTVVAWALWRLHVSDCFTWNHPVADILAPQLQELEWKDHYDPRSVELGNIAQLQHLSTRRFVVYGAPDSTKNHGVSGLLKRFQVINSLRIKLTYHQDIGNSQYLMEDITMLPRIKFLHLLVINKGHIFGASLFHVLRLCTGIRGLRLDLHNHGDLEEPPECSPGCICDQQTNWKTEELTLNHLKFVEIIRLKGAEHEVAFVKRLFGWATVLKKMRITLDYSISESKARELRQTFSSFSKPKHA